MYDMTGSDGDGGGNSPYERVYESTAPRHEVSQVTLENIGIIYLFPATQSVFLHA
jgi:hypothetical protein